MTDGIALTLDRVTRRFGVRAGLLLCNNSWGDKKVAKKLKLDLSELEVQVFAVPDSYENVRGTVQGQTADGDTCGIGVTCLEEHTCTCTCDPEYTQLCPTIGCPTGQCGTQTPGDTVCYDTITCCET